MGEDSEPDNVSDTTRAVNGPPRSWKLFVVPIVVVALLVGGGLLLRDRIGSPADVVGSSASGSTAPNFAAATVNGPRFSLVQERGHPVVLFFMAAWCTSCLLESNALGRIQQTYGDRVRVALVDIGKRDSGAALRSFVEKSQGPSRYWILDADGRVASAYGVQSLDTTYVIDKRGRVAYTVKLPVGYADLKRALSRVL